MAKETYSYGKRGLKRPNNTSKPVAKETYVYGKRDLFIRQKRPKEA
jgi:hypothetical protein